MVVMFWDGMGVRFHAGLGQVCGSTSLLDLPSHPSGAFASLSPNQPSPGASSRHKGPPLALD